MPIMSDKIVYKELALKAPITLRMQIPKETILGAKKFLGQTVGNQTVDSVRWGLVVNLCKEDEPDCTTSVTGLSVMLWSYRANNVWQLHVYFAEFYTTPTAKFIIDAFKFGQETDVTIDITFRDSTVSITLNGKEILTTDTLKKFAQIRELGAQNEYLDTNLQEVNITDYNAYNLQTIQITTIDTLGLVNAIVPIAVAIAIVGVVLSLFKTGIFKTPVPRT